MTASARYERAIAAIDAANADDPRSVEIRGVFGPKELVHAKLMTEWVLRLDPDASESQLLAARAHHLRRWTVPRTTYPDGRAGYLRWRTALRKQHAAEVGVVLADVGYDRPTIERVQSIINKVALSTDPVVQVHEDALCLVFLETQLAETADRLGDDKIVDVIQKTAAKMSTTALAHVADLPFRVGDRELLERALSS